tara:strand:+ start:15012 stop:15734 length:723 start_codon:yes stop_codon:yes gene_type:complete
VFLSIVLILSVIGACINELHYKPVYSAKFEVAPHFEFAYDLGEQLKQLAKNVNISDSIERYKRTGLTIPNNGLFNCSVTKIKAPAEGNFKHIKLRFNIETHHTSQKQLLLIDSFLVKFCDDFIFDPKRKYKGMEVLKSKLKAFSNEDTSLIRNYSKTKNFFKDELSKKGVEVSDQIIHEIIHAQLQGELNNAQTNNYNTTLNKSLEPKKRIFSGIQIFLMITFLPSILITAILRAKEYDK